MSAFGLRPPLNASAAPLPPPTANDVEVVNPPADSVSSIAWSPQADFLAVASWDTNTNVRIYEVGSNGQTQGRAAYDHQGPVLDVCWSSDGTKVFSGGTDNAARMYDLATGQAMQVAQHDAPVKCVRWVDQPQGGNLVTGSWDKTVKFWDLRTPNPVASFQLPDRCYSMDALYPKVVVGTADNQIVVMSLDSQPGNGFWKVPTNPLKWATRVVTCFKDGFGIGSIEGRVAIQYYEERDLGKSFTFRCHRKESPTSKTESMIYAVNDISFHPQFGTFTTCGSDGAINIWDGDARSRLKAFDNLAGPITCTAFNRSGTILAYAVSYDWHKGFGGMTPGHPNKVMLHPVKEDEVKRKTPMTKPRA